MNYIELCYFLKEEANGAIFAKIGKSKDMINGKGGTFPYRDYIGKRIDFSNEKTEKYITFEKLGNVWKYFHYGDDLIIFSFENISLEDNFVCIPDDNGNKDAFKTNQIFVKNVMTLNDPNTIEYIYSNASKESFNDCNRQCINRLEEYKFNAAANKVKSLYSGNIQEDNDVIGVSK